MTMMTPEEELLDEVAQSVLRNLLSEDDETEPNNEVVETTQRTQRTQRTLQTSSIHDNSSKELNENDSSGLQGGQAWRPPTRSPTVTPTTFPSLSPTGEPTAHPTPKGDPFVLKGYIWYDRNANGERDSNVNVKGLGGDVEYGFGLGGVQVYLVECDPETLRAVREEEDSSSLSNSNSYAMAVTQGYDVQMHPKLVRGGGKYNLVNIKINRSYFIEVVAPDGYLFTGGVCNDEIEGWECEYLGGGNSGSSGGRTSETGAGVEVVEESEAVPSANEDAIPSESSQSQSGASSFASGGSGGGRRLGQLGQPGQLRLSGLGLARHLQAVGHSKNSGKEPNLPKLGISSGRSSQCINVDKAGMADSTIDLGVMREGDAKEAKTQVALVLDFDDEKAGSGSGGKAVETDKAEVEKDASDASAFATDADIVEGRKDRQLIQAIDATPLPSISFRELKARVLQGLEDGRTQILPNGEQDGKGALTHRYRYLLGEDEKTAIGTVTAEVLAGTLDKRLAENGVDLDSVEPREVILSTSDNGKNSKKNAANNSAGTADQLAVQLEVKGHYSPPPEIDFDYLVQDSINRETDSIRRNLQDYNQNCREQTTKVNDGFSKNDFNEIHSTSGASSRGGTNNGANAVNSVFRTACSQGDILPDIFETSLKQISARTEVEFDRTILEEVVYIAEESRLESWAMGPLAAISGLIALLMGAFVFRRAVGPRYKPDSYKERNTTKEVGEEGKRFGEAGGAMDDGSVDSAFYSDVDEEEMDEKERKRKRKQKEKMAGLKRKNAKSTRKMLGGKSRRHLNIHGDDGSVSVAKSARSVKSARSKSSHKGRKSAKSTRNLMTISQGSEETDSVGKSSEEDFKEQGGHGKRKSRRESERSDRGDRGERSGRRESERNERGDKAERARKRSSRKEKEDKLDKPESKRRQSERSDRGDKGERGRNKRSGGDNARIVEEADIV